MATTGLTPVVYGRRAREYGMRLFQRPWTNYLLAPMVDHEGNRVPYQSFAYIVHGIVAVFSEVLIRTVLSFIYVLILADLNAGVINFTQAALCKGLALGGAIMILGRVSAYSRFGNVWASYVPSSKRMWSPDGFEPPLDLLHCIGYSVFQYVGSILGLSLALWMSNFSTINLGQPSVTADTFGLFGAHVVSVNQIFLIELAGSALITFTWLMLVVHQRGAKNQIHAGIAMGFITFAISAPTISATGANFDFLHYAALQTILANAKVVNTNHTFVYLFAPVAGLALAWVGYFIIASLTFSIDYGKPGIPGYTADFDPINATAHLPSINNLPGNLVPQHMRLPPGPLRVAGPAKTNRSGFHPSVQHLVARRPVHSASNPREG
jgi:glycerol uptake facilitator-like aquaporin